MTGAGRAGRQGRGAWRALAGLVAAACLAGWASLAPVRAEPLVLTPDGMAQMGFLLIDRGMPAEAARVARALLVNDPDSAVALMILSRAERDLGNNTSAIAHGRRAWALAEGPEARHAAAMTLAQGLASDGRRLAAQWWLRRAAEVAPSAAARAVAVRDFRYVQSRTRASLRIDVDIRPSSNVNGGSSAKVLDFFGLPMTISPDGQALSGLRGQVALTAGWRLAEHERAKTDLRLGLVERRVVLSDAAKAAAPAARAGRYAFSAVEVGIDRAWKTGAPGGEARLSATLGHNRYGGAPMSDYLRLDASLGRNLSAATAGRVGLSLERQARLDVPSRSARIAGLTLGLGHRLNGGDRLDLSLGVTRSLSAESDIDHRALSADLTWTLARPVMGASVTAGIGVEGRDYATSAFKAGGRSDLSVEGRVSMTSDRLDYMGFVPVVTLQAERTRSDVAINRSQSLGIGLSVRSSF